MLCFFRWLLLTGHAGAAQPEASHRAVLPTGAGAEAPRLPTVSACRSCLPTEPFLGSPLYERCVSLYEMSAENTGGSFW